MSFDLTVKFDDATDFSFDTALVEIAATVARLKDLGGGTFSTTNPQILTNYPVTASDITSFADSITEPGSDEIRHILEIERVDRYWDGSSWAASDGTFAQSNDSATINTNLATLVSGLGLTGNFSLRVKTLLHSDAGTSTPTITSITQAHDFSEPSFTQINECVITANLGDLFGDKYIPADPPMLYVTNDRSFNHTNNTVLPFTKSVAFDGLGQASMSVIETETVGENLNFYVTYREGKSVKFLQFEPAVVPNTTSKPLTEVTSVVDSDLS